MSRGEYTIDLRGKEYTLYPGLLDSAHQHGLQSIDEEIIQIPNDANGQLAIVRAVVTDGDERRFTGIGDASPENVGRNIAPHVLRMASTRAKARAFRDLLGLEDPAFEELGDSSSQDAPESSRQAAPASTLKPAPATSQEPVGATEAQREMLGLPASPEQREMLRVLLMEWAEVQRGKPEKAIAVFEGRNGPISHLTAEQANEHIERLSEIVGSPE